MKKFAVYHPLVMRLSLTFVFGWFGISEILDPKYWSGYIPEMAEKLLPIPLLSLVQIHGIVLVLLAACLILRFYLKYVGALAVFVLLSIIGGLISMQGFNEIVVRDIGLLGLALSIWLHEINTTHS